MRQYVFHLVGNAHLDPVWLWDWREGLNEGLITCRTILDLMDQDAELTFTRGEAAIYDHIERTDPQTFQRIAKQVKAGRWEVVGGTWIQPDTNLPATATFARHLMRGLRYFADRFGKQVKIAWTADSFGHSAGLPEIYAAAGIEHLVFTRPAQNLVAIDGPLFWWQGPGGARILACRPAAGWYGAERGEMPDRLNAMLSAAGKFPWKNLLVPYGLGNHGGGPTRGQIADIRRWAGEHPEVKVVFSTMSGFFQAAMKEVQQNEKNVPVVRGELNFTLRGCYASVAKFKYAYRATEAVVSAAEKTDAAVAACGGGAAADFTDTWDAILFNSFHDILPGSSIERAYEDQLAWLGAARHQAAQKQFAALNSLARRLDSRVPPAKGDDPALNALLLFNPCNYPFDGYMELETNLDYRPIWAYRGKADEVPVTLSTAAGKPVNFQLVQTEHTSMVDLPWRKRAVAKVKIPPMGWTLLRMGYTQSPKLCAAPADAAGNPEPGVVDNGIYQVRAALDGNEIKITRQGRPIFHTRGLGVRLYDDPYGSWGAMDDARDSTNLSRVREEWRITQIQTLEQGPHRSALWVRLAGLHSHVDLTIQLYRGRAAVDVQARVIFNERSARLKLIFPVAGEAEFDVPGATVRRGELGEVPGGRWVRIVKPVGFGFASDSLYGFDCADGELRATVCRASRYANDVATEAPDKLWQPAVDAGELKFRFLINDGGPDLQRLAEQLETPPVALTIPPAAAQQKPPLPASGSLAQLKPASVQVLAIKRAEAGDGFIIQVQERGGKNARPSLVWCGQSLKPPAIKANQLACWKLRRSGKEWNLQTVGLDEK